MKFIIDENISIKVVEFLRIEKHDVLYVAENIKSFDDVSILKMAFKEKRILVTKDKDFGGLVFKNNFPHSGIIFLRLSDDSGVNTIKILTILLKMKNINFIRSFITVNDRNVRVVEVVK